MFKRARLFCALQCCISFILLVIGGLCSFYFGSEAVELLSTSKVPSDLVTQFEYNWEIQPLVDISLVYGPCPSDYEPIFNRPWGGIEEGCASTLQQSNETVVWTKGDHDNFEESLIETDGSTCSTILPIVHLLRGQYAAPR